MRTPDHIMDAVHAVLRTGSGEDWKAVWDGMDDRARLRSDHYLVGMNDALAWRTGLPEKRFRACVLFMADLARQRRGAGERRAVRPESWISPEEIQAAVLASEFHQGLAKYGTFTDFVACGLRAGLFPKRID